MKNFYLIGGLIAVLALILVLVLFVFQFSQPPKKEPSASQSSKEMLNVTAPSDWQTYFNQTYKYQIKYPKDWRIAREIMEWRRKNISYKSSIDDWVVLTDLSYEKEKECLNFLENYKKVGQTFDYLKCQEGWTIVVQPAIGLVKEVKENKIPGIEIIDFREQETKEGLKIFRFQEKIDWQEKDLEVAQIPYLRQNSETGPFISFSVERRGNDYPKDIFEKIISSFKIIKEQR
jgi:hypothetical protein